MRLKIRRVLGYTMLIAAIPLCLLAIFRFKEIILSLINFAKIFTGKSNAAESGKITGHLVFWVFYFVLIYLFLKYGNKWAKLNPKTK